MIGIAARLMVVSSLLIPVGIFGTHKDAGNQASLFAASAILSVPMDATATDCGICYCCSGQSCFSHHEIRDGSMRKAHGCTSGQCNDPMCPDPTDFDGDDLALVWNEILDGTVDVVEMLAAYPDNVEYNAERGAVQVWSPCADQLIAHIPLRQSQLRQIAESVK